MSLLFLFFLYFCPWNHVLYCDVANRIVENFLPRIVGVENFVEIWCKTRACFTKIYDLSWCTVHSTLHITSRRKSQSIFVTPGASFGLLVSVSFRAILKTYHGRQCRRFKLNEPKNVYDPLTELLFVCTCKILSHRENLIFKIFQFFVENN